MREIKQVQEFCYPVNTITEDGRNKARKLTGFLKEKKAFLCKKSLTS